MALPLQEALAIVVHAFCEVGISRCMSTDDFLRCAAEVCTKEQYDSLQHILSNENAQLVTKQHVFVIRNSTIRGLSLKPNAETVQICHVTAENFDECYQKCILLSGVEVFRQNHPLLFQRYRRIEHLRQEIATKQAKLADETFRIACADQARYHKVKTRNKVIEHAKRAARRSERQLRTNA